LIKEKVREFIAVNDYAVLLRAADLKRQALMFDRVALPFVKQVIERGEYEGFDEAFGLHRLQPLRSTSSNNHSYLFAGIHVTNLPQRIWAVSF
jgi:hypothetical protein